MDRQRVRTVYVTGSGSYLPGDAISNEEMEQRLGLVGGHHSRLRHRILKSNGIESRHYAIDAEGRQTHLNEELAAEAARRALAARGCGVDDVEMLAFGTSIPDIILPGFASMVHGRLGGRPAECLSSGGVCASSIGALRAAVNAVKVGDHSVVLAGGSELASQMMRASRFQKESELAPSRENTAVSFQYFNADFLRWMLSDGAGAVVLEPKPRPNGLSLRVEFVELTSYAHRLSTCMYLGMSDPTAPGVGKTFLSVDKVSSAEDAGMMFIRQDTKLLAANIAAVLTEECSRLRAKYNLVADEIDWFLPHMSSYFFHEHIITGLRDAGLDIPEERWFTNLKNRGNTGAASFYIMLDDALSGGLLQPGQKVLAMIPESGRFTAAYAMFTVVSPDYDA